MEYTAETIRRILLERGFPQDESGKVIATITPDRLEYQYGLYHFSSDRTWWSKGGILKTTAPRRFLQAAAVLGLPVQPLPRRRPRSRKAGSEQIDS